MTMNVITNRKKAGIVALVLGMSVSAVYGAYQHGRVGLVETKAALRVSELERDLAQAQTDKAETESRLAQAETGLAKAEGELVKAGAALRAALGDGEEARRLLASNEQTIQRLSRNRDELQARLQSADKQQAALVLALADARKRQPEPSMRNALNTVVEQAARPAVGTGQRDEDMCHARGLPPGCQRSDR
jgi:chromosome segregation ATPase